MSSSHRPILLIVSAPSGAGKSTLCRMLREEFPGMAYSVSCTTRPPRGQEKDGREYHFLSPAEFEARVQRGEFLEHALVHGNRYGTLMRTVQDALSAGRDVLMDIDVQGARQIREKTAAEQPGSLLRKSFVDVFVTPPSIEELRKRIMRRNENAPEDTERRLAQAAREMAAATEYRHRVVNDDLQTAYAELRAILQAEHRRRID